MRRAANRCDNQRIGAAQDAANPKDPAGNRGLTAIATSPRQQPSHQRRKLMRVAALMHLNQLSIRMRHRIPSRPHRSPLRIKPVSMPSRRNNPKQRTQIGIPTISTRITQDNHRSTRTNRISILGIKITQGPTIITVPIKRSNLRLTKNTPTQQLRISNPRTNKMSDLIHSLHKSENPHPTELIPQRLHQQHSKVGEPSHRPRHITDQNNIRPPRPGPPIRQPQRHPTRRQRPTQGPTNIDPPTSSSPTTSSQPSSQLPRQRPNSPTQLSKLSTTGRKKVHPISSRRHSVRRDPLTPTHLSRPTQRFTAH